MKRYTKPQIVNYLETQIKQSAKNDIGTVIDVYMNHWFDTGEGIGFFAIPRLIFPEIDNVASLYTGKADNNTTENSIHFMRKYFGRVNQEYTGKSAFIYLIYRHGLMHQHEPKNMTYKYKSVGWMIGLSSSNTGRANGHLRVSNGMIQIDGRQFYEDFLAAVDIY